MEPSGHSASTLTKSLWEAATDWSWPSARRPEAKLELRRVLKVNARRMELVLGGVSIARRDALQVEAQLDRRLIER